MDKDRYDSEIYSLFPMNNFDEHPSWYILEQLPYTFYPFLFAPVLLHWIRVYILSKGESKKEYDFIRNIVYFTVFVLFLIFLDMFYRIKYFIFYSIWIKWRWYFYFIL